MRVFDRDLIRGGHYGQRSCEPHLKAEHMAAPTSLQREISLANRSRFWGGERKFLEPLMRFALGDVRDHIG